jgi:phosphoglucosamine mutase
LTTPGIAILTRQQGFDAGAVVSASHNPYNDNGIKVLAADGMKPREDYELEIEHELAKAQSLAIQPSDLANVGGARRASSQAEALRAEYIAWLRRLAPHPLNGMRLVMDCANGAACEIAPKLVESLGMRVRSLHASPNGRNINQECGSLHPEGMARATAIEEADLGVAFDGDADRAIFATREGRILNGDFVLYLAAVSRQQRGALPNHLVVGTLMTNLALERALAMHSISLKRTAVGDKFVLEEMLRSGAEVGGEPSGHVIFSNLSLAGDGLVTLLEVLRLMVESGESLGQLAAGLKLFPQTIRNLRVLEQPPMETLPGVSRAIEDCRRAIGARGRVVVRYSGTEPLVRVMVEGEDAGQVDACAQRIVAAIEASLGAQAAEWR